MRRISQRCLSAVAGLAAALVVAPPVSAATSTPHSRPNTQQRTETFQLVAKQTQSESLDLGKKGIGRGDQLVIAEDLYRDGRKIGDHSVVCVYVLRFGSGLRPHRPRREDGAQPHLPHHR
jgi:hypothetical protein